MEYVMKYKQKTVLTPLGRLQEQLIHELELAQGQGPNQIAQMATFADLQIGTQIMCARFCHLQIDLTDLI